MISGLSFTFFTRPTFQRHQYFYHPSFISIFTLLMGTEKTIVLVSFLHPWTSSCCGFIEKLKYTKELITSYADKVAINTLPDLQLWLWFLPHYCEILALFTRLINFTISSSSEAISMVSSHITTLKFSSYKLIYQFKSCRVFYAVKCESINLGAHFAALEKPLTPLYLFSQCSNCIHIIIPSDLLWDGTPTVWVPSIVASISHNQRFSRSLRITT